MYNKFLNRLNFVDQFSKARAKLVYWNVLLMFIVIGTFSTIRYEQELTNIRSAALRHEFGKFIPASLSDSQELHVQELVDDLIATYVMDQLIIDMLVISSVAILTYFLATKTLQPILQSMLREKEFVANASHELRTPITAIRTACEIAIRGKDKPLEEYKKVLQQAHDESTRMAKIIDDMLLLSRTDAGTEKLKVAHVALDKLATAVYNELLPLAIKKNITLTSEITADAVVQGDPAKIKQLIIILVDNALKYTNSGGAINIKVVATPRVSLLVSDTGIGMNEEDKKHIFERFYRGDKSRGQTEGTGLGLSIANWIVRTHNATIYVDSVVNKGSTFTVEFRR